MSLFRDIESTRWLYAKGVLFLLLAVLAGGVLLIRVPGIDTAVLLMICVWASCRAYYFAFYVIEHYVDPEYRFSGIIDFMKYATGRQRQQVTRSDPGQGGQNGTHE